jgi:tRNA A-37 threonylcarbamoyl transferase component Bud32
MSTHEDLSMLKDALDSVKRAHEKLMNAVMASFSAIHQIGGEALAFGSPDTRDHYRDAVREMSRIAADALRAGGAQ